MRYYVCEVMFVTTGERIKYAREKANMTQSELAQKLNISFQSISQWERDIRKPKKETLASIADALGIDPLELSDDLFDNAFLSALQQAFGIDEEFRTAFLNNDVAIAILRSDNDRLLLEFYNMLNEAGQLEAISLISRLTEFSKYLKDRYTKTPDEFRKLQEDSKPLPYPQIKNKPPQD